jgi:hypothetical protein
VIFSAVGLLIATAAITARASTISAVSWDHDDSGRTIVTVIGAEPISDSVFRTYPLEDPPRAVIVISGISEPVDPDQLVVGDRNIDRIRTIHHPERRPRELLVVLDLTPAGAEILALRADGNRLIAIVGAPTDDPEPPAVLPPAGPPPTAADPAAVQTPTALPSPTSTTTPTAVLVPPTPRAIETLSHPDRPAPPALPRSTETAIVDSAPAPYLATPAPIAERITASRAVDVSASHRSDGSSLILITADGDLPPACARTLAVAADPPRIVISITGITAPGLGRSIELDDPNIARIRLIHDAEIAAGELHLVLHLARPDVEVQEIKQVGPNLVVRIGPRYDPDTAP